MDLSSSLFPVDFPWASGPVGPVDLEADARHRQWLEAGRNGEMAYLDRYREVRADPRLLLPGARSILCVAFPYFTSEPVRLPVSLYARGRDYHEVVREQLAALARRLPPGDSRICVDTAPLRERYWAARLGLGFIGRNNQLIIPGLGSYFFLGFILTTAELPAARWCNVDGQGCGNCRRCVDACPGNCIFPSGEGIDARKCLSYLTIEYRGELGDLSLPTLYGCDVCQRVCPFNSNPEPTPISDFHPAPALCNLTADELRQMTPEQFAATFRHSAVKRTKLAGLQRNLANLRSASDVNTSETESSRNAGNSNFRLPDQTSPHGQGEASETDASATEHPLSASTTSS